jgi:hypothetical protein
MTENQELSGRRRRSGEEIKRLVLEFEASGLRQNEFCRNQGLALSTLQRQLRKRRLDKGETKEGSRFVAVELTRFLEYPELELSNNLAENSMRPVALGRRNWIHIGSEEAGPRVAAIVSVVETCRRLKIPIRDYLCSILPGLANFPINRIAELTPAAWLARN